MATERPPWWKAFLPKKKSGLGTKDTAAATTVEPEFNPFDPAKTPGGGGGGGQPLSTNKANSKGSSLLSDETFDDSRLESMFNEQTCRRNMNVSRSGRFKEKRRVRGSLPINDKETENVASGNQDKW